MTDNRAKSVLGGPRRIAVTLASTVALALSTGCGVGLEQVPLPAPGVGSDTYALTATFTNALNLPDGAKVRVNGADVGEVVAMKAQGFHAEVTIKVASSTSLPVGTTAQLRSATPLGDVFLALEPPQDSTSSTPLLADGDSIGVGSTSSAATVEEVLSTSSLLVNGGAIRNMTKIVNGLGAAVGEDGSDAARLIDDTTAMIDSLSRRTGDIRMAVASTNSMSKTLAAQQESIAEALEGAGPAVDVVADNTSTLIDLVATVAGITGDVSRFPSMQGTDNRSTVADMNKLSYWFNQASLNPHADIDMVNSLLGPLIKATSSTSAHANIDIAGVALGAVDDPGHKADPGMRVPDGTDVAYMIGSFSYLLTKLYDNAAGGR